MNLWKLYKLIIMKAYPLPKSPPAIFQDQDDEPLRLTKRVSALYGQHSSGEKFVVPEIWLHGKWLEEAGFELGDHIGIEVHQGRLSIIKLELWSILAEKKEGYVSLET